MTSSRRQIVTAVSVIYLLGLTSIAGYALYSSNVYNLPIPNIIGALTIALPPLAGVALETVLSVNDRLAAKGQLQASRMFQVVIASFLVFESVLATLSGTHYSPPGNLNCALGEMWQRLFSGHHAKSIQRIQDSFNCCGFNSQQDRAWPFPDTNHGADACLVRYERDQSCLGPWREEERKVAIMLMVVPIAVFVWQIAIILAPSSQSSWLPSHIQLPSDTSADGSAERRKPRAAIGYRDLEDIGEEDSIQREVTNLNNDSQLATRVESQRTKSAGLLGDHERWQGDHRERAEA